MQLIFARGEEEALRAPSGRDLSPAVILPDRAMPRVTGIQAFKALMANLKTRIIAVVTDAA